MGFRDSFPIRHSKWIARVLGICCWLALFGTGGAVIGSDFGIGLYAILIGILVFILEASWILNKCRCYGEGGCCDKSIRVMAWIDTWKKFIVYVGLSIVCFLHQNVVIAAGIVLLLTAIAYGLGTFRENDPDPRASVVDSKYGATGGSGEPDAVQRAV